MPVADFDTAEEQKLEEIRRALIERGTNLNRWATKRRFVHCTARLALLGLCNGVTGTKIVQTFRKDFPDIDLTITR